MIFKVILKSYVGYKEYTLKKIILIILPTYRLFLFIILFIAEDLISRLPQLGHFSRIFPNFFILKNSNNGFTFIEELKVLPQGLHL